MSIFRRDGITQAGYHDGALILPMVFCVIAAPVIIHGLSLAPLARLLKLASGSPPGLLIVGASPWTVALAQALRNAGVPSLLADPSWKALRSARRLGLATAHLEILSSVGDHMVDLRDLDYLYAATDDDAYNALVCMRFAPELGQERVHQPPPIIEREQIQTHRDWRGKYAPHRPLTHLRLSELIADGFGFTQHTSDDGASNLDGERWPVISLLADGGLSFSSPDQDAPLGPGRLTLWFERVSAVTKSTPRGSARRSG